MADVSMRGVFIRYGRETSGCLLPPQNGGRVCCWLQQGAGLCELLSCSGGAVNDDVVSGACKGDGTQGHIVI